MAQAANIKPISMEPVSPINTRAGNMLCGKNPKVIPTNNAEINVGKVALEKPNSTLNK